jgi:hypothetical protein
MSKPRSKPMTDIQETLAERGSRYGEFDEHARITQNLKRAMADSPNWSALPDDMKEALEMVAHKMGRILNGDPDYDDSWRDIIGYTQLVLNRLELPTPRVAQPAFAFVSDAEGRN